MFRIVRGTVCPFGGVLLLLFVFAGCVLAESDTPSREALENVRTWPLGAELQGKRVNLRGEPSAKGPLLGQFTDDMDAGELLVIDVRHTGEEYAWYLTVSEKYGEGWIYGKYLRFLPEGDALSRLFRRIRNDFGVNRAMMEKRFGKPDQAEVDTLELADWNVAITSISLAYHGHNAVFWNYRGRDRLRLLEIAGGWMDFGGVLQGTPAEEIRDRLGEPFAGDATMLQYLLNREELLFYLEKGKVVSMLYRKAIFD